MKKSDLIHLVNQNDFYSIWEFRYEICGSFDGFMLIAENVNVQHYENYVTAVDIYGCDDGLIGVSGVFDKNDNVKDYHDIGITCYACEYEAFQTVSYQPKN